MQPQSQTTSPSSGRRAAVYIRTGVIAETTDSNLPLLNAYAGRHGYQVVETYRDDGKSGRDLKRPALGQLRADAAKGRFDVVLVTHRSQIASTEVDAHTVIQEIRGHGVTVESIADDINF